MNKYLLSPTNNSSSIDCDAAGIYGIDATKGIRTLNNNVKIYAKLLKTFSANTMYDEFMDAINQGDMDQASAKAHALKGVTANLHIDLVYKLMMDLETATKSGENVSPEDPRITQLKEVYTKTMESVNSVIENPALLEPYKK